MKHPGQVIKKYREEKKLTQIQTMEMLAERGIEVKRQAYSRWENEGKMSAWVLLNIADILDIPNMPGIFLHEELQERHKALPPLNSAGQHLQKQFTQLLMESDRYQYSEVEVDPVRTIPKIMLAASAGTGQPDTGSGYEEVPRPLCAPEGDDIVMLTVAGLSMLPKYNDGDNIFVRKKAQYNDGDIVIVRRNDELFIKQLVLSNGRLVRFDSLNEEYDSVELHEFDDVQIQGEVIGKVE